MPSSSVTASPHTFATACFAERVQPVRVQGLALGTKRVRGLLETRVRRGHVRDADRLVELPCEQRAAQILVGREEVFDEKQFGERRRDLREGDALLERVVRLRLRGQPRGRRARRDWEHGRHRTCLGRQEWKAAPRLGRA